MTNLNNLIMERGWKKISADEQQHLKLAKLKQGVWVQRGATISYVNITDVEKTTNEAFSFSIAKAAGHEVPNMLTEALGDGNYLYVSDVTGQNPQTLEQIGKENLTPDIVKAITDRLSINLALCVLIGNFDIQDSNIIVAWQKNANNILVPHADQIDNGYLTIGERITPEWLVSRIRNEFDYIAKQYGSAALPFKLNREKVEEGIDRVESLTDEVFIKAISQMVKLAPQEFSIEDFRHSLEQLRLRQSVARKVCTAKVIARRFD